MTEQPEADGRGDRSVRLGPSAAGRCRRRIHLENDPTADWSRRTPADPGLQLQIGNLAEHRHRIHGRLAASLDLDTTWTQASPERPGAVWAPRLITSTRTAVPDLLLRSADGGYLPVLVRGHRTLDPGSGAVCSALATPWAASPSSTRKPRPHHADALALAHLYRMLQELGLASAQARGGVIGHGGRAADPDWDDGAVILWHDLGLPSRTGPAGTNLSGGPAVSVLADYDSRFADRLAVAGAAAARLPALAWPSRIAECRRCPWWTVCGPELVAAHDVSLLAAGADVDVLHRAGVVTYDDLAAMAPAAAAALPLTGIPPGDARARARALIVGVPMVRRRERVDPVRADVELDVDMESYLDDGAYLWGTYLTGAALRGFPPGYRPFVTWQPLDAPSAGENFAAFWRYLAGVRQACAGAGLSFAAYCYSRKAEERWLYGTPRRFPAVAGMPTLAEIAAFCSSPQWVDLYAEVKRCFVVPGSLRLKTIATVAGFSWRDPEPGGENSMAWYRIATDGDGVLADAISGGDGVLAAGLIGTPAAESHSAEVHRRRILGYNEDDVLATLALRRWMTERASEMPTVADLEAGALSSR